jgi:hypothetical protein
VLADFTWGHAGVLKELAGRDQLPAGWAEDPKFPQEWDWDKRYYGQELVKRAWDEVIHPSTTFWANLRATPNAENDLFELNKLSEEHDVCFITQRTGKKVKYQTEEWLYAHGMEFPSVLVVSDYKNKLPLIKDLGIEFFVDDKLETIRMVDNHFNGNQDFHATNNIYLFDAPYNREGREGLKVVYSVTEALINSELIIL